MKPALIRPRRAGPRTFETFPEEVLCPICKTNDDGETVLIAIDGTSDGKIAEAKPTHLACAVAEQLNEKSGIIYRRLP